MRKNIVEPDRPQMTMWRMGIAYWMTKATNMHSEYVLLATATSVVQTLVSVMLYVA
jgi:hypothetical protein